MKTIVCSLLVDLLEYSEDRSPWESIEDKLDEIRFVNTS